MKHALLILLALGCGPDPRVTGDATTPPGGEDGGVTPGDFCTAGQTRSCYTGPAATRGIGACHDGVMSCAGEEIATWGECIGDERPVTELCDHVDNDCDGVTDEGLTCPTVSGSCLNSGGSCSSTLVTAPPPVTSSTCRIALPASLGVPCTVPASGPDYYLSATTGSDSNTGTSPAQPWQTLCHAMAAMPDGATLNVAEGTYANAEVSIVRPIVVKGGWSSSFSVWDPDAHRTRFLGRLHLNHTQAVWGGFEMLSGARPEGDGGPFNYYHHVIAGTLIRNRITISYPVDPATHYVTGVIASACAQLETQLRCNDVYVAAPSSVSYATGIAYGNSVLHDGHAIADSNRVCVNAVPGQYGSALTGYGTCAPATVPASVTLTNNLLETTSTSSGEGVEFYSCGGPSLEVVMTNNTILGRNGIAGYGNAPFVHWTLANNVLAGQASSGQAIATGGVIVSSQYNLAFGFATNAISPTPMTSIGDDTSGTSTLTNVFVNAAAGDFRPRAGGAADSTGTNLYNVPAYGSVTHDLGQQPRPATGVWDRGALAN